MRKIISIIMICTFISYTMTLHASFVSGEEKDATLINSFEKDMTGDGFQEYIRLQGNILNNKNAFYQDVWLTIQNKFKKEWSISLQHGYKPEATLIDLTGNNQPDIFYQAAKDEQMKHFHYQLYSINQNKAKALDVPTHQHAKATFSHDFTLELTTNPTKKPITLDLSDKKELYTEKNVYRKNGEPTGDIKPVIDQYGTMEPILLSNSKGYGLKTAHHIHGLDESDLVGKLVTTWHFEKNKWINVKTEIVPEA